MALKELTERRSFHLVAAIVLAAAVALVYSNTLHSSFHFDDFRQIVDNPRVRSFTYLPYILFREVRGVTFHTFALNYAAAGHSVFGYHLVNTAIHIANSIIVYFLLYLTLRGRVAGSGWAKRIAFFTAALFAVHPVQTQSVTYIVQRMESLSALFFLLGMLIFAVAAGMKASPGKVIAYICVPLCYVLGFYSKEVVVTLPVVILLYDLYFVSGRGRGSLFRRWPLYASLGALFIYFTVSTVVPLGGFDDLSDKLSSLEERASEAVLPVDASPGLSLESTAQTAEISPEQAEEPSTPWNTVGFSLEGLSSRQYLLTQFNVLTYYLSLLLVPVNQNLDYDFPISDSLFESPTVRGGTVLNYPIPPPALSLVILAVIIGAALYLAARSRKPGGGRAGVMSFFILWFFVTLAPTSSFIPIMDVIFEHRLYLASLGFFLTLVCLIDCLISALFGARTVVSGGLESGR